MRHGRHRVLPEQDFSGHQLAEVTGTRAHVAVGQLEPGASERIGKRLRVLVETPGDFLVGRVHAQRQVGRGHHRRMLLRRVMGIGDQVLGLAVNRRPLMGTGRALAQLPLVAQQHVEVAVVPGGRVGFPGPLDTAGGGVHTLAAAEFVAPAQALRLNRRGLRLGADQARITGAVGLAEGMPAGHQGHGFFVVHGHTGEGFAHIAARGDRIGIAVRAFRVHVDQAHLHGGQRVFQLAIARVAAVGLVTGGQPLAFGAPVDVFFRRPDVRPATGKAEGLEAHGLQRDVAGQDHQVGPGQLAPVLLFDRPEQAPRLVEVAVVRPAIQWGKPLVAGTGTATAIGGPVGTGGVPGHADHQAAVVAPVRWPPVLGVSHQGGKVLDHGVEVEAFEFFGVVEILAHWVGQGGVLMEDFQVQLVGPPIGIAACATGHGLLVRTARERAFGVI